MVNTNIFNLPSFVTATIIATSLCVGCSSKDYGPTGTVAGSVSHNGVPISQGVSVVFMDVTAGHTCAGVTDPSGNFQLNTFNGGNLPVGTYGVMIRPRGTMDMAAMEAATNSEDALNEAGIAAPPVASFPSKYNDLASSGLVFEVKEGSNEFQIELVD